MTIWKQCCCSYLPQEREGCLGDSGIVAPPQDWTMGPRWEAGPGLGPRQAWNPQEPFSLCVLLDTLLGAVWRDLLTPYPGGVSSGQPGPGTGREVSDEGVTEVRPLLLPARSVWPCEPGGAGSTGTWPLGDSPEAPPCLEEGCPGLETTLPGQEPRNEVEPPPAWVRRQGACLCLTFMALQHLLLAFLRKGSHQCSGSSDCLAVDRSGPL